ncbi:MAG: glycosyltransferase family 9 protein [Calditrichaeota bacterium]|nr:glycosyltransferase family 9 protein [Calditrichota bacterium]
MSNKHRLEQLRQKLLSGDGKLLIIQTAFLGDIILLTTLLRGVRKAFPNAELHVLTRPEGVKVLQGQADKIIEFDKRDRSDLAERWKKLVVQLKDQNYNVALIPHRSFRSSLTAFKAGIPIRIGFKRGLASWFLTHKVKYEFKTYEGERNLELLRVIKDDDYEQLPLLLLNNYEEELADSLLNSLTLRENEFVVIAPGSVWKSKRWSMDHYHRLKELIESEYKLPVVTIGGGEDTNLCMDIISDPKRNFAGLLNPMKSAAIVKRARLLISGDTAPAHIATAVRTRQVIIFGSTAPCFGFAPDIPDTRIVELKLWCRPCSNHGRNFCPNLGSYKCMENTSAEAVVEKIKDWLD